MRIGLIAPPFLPVPPAGYGGTEAVVANLARGLSELGHDVQLFTVGESTSPQASGHVFDEAVTPIGERVAEAIHVVAAYETLADVDIIHDHTVLGPLFAQNSKLVTPAVVTTVHGEFTPLLRRLYTLVGTSTHIVAISHDQAARAGSVPIAAVIHHGVDLDAYRPGPGDGDYLVFVGRMSPDKGVDKAIRIARAAGVPLRLICKIREPEETEYFRRVVEPMLGHGVELDLELPLAERVELVGGALALLDPLEWPEPFGLVMAEALACGTPVIAYPCGAAPEIVTDGVTGFLVTSLAEAVDAVGRVPQLSRTACRDDAERRFSVRRMAEDHERLYTETLSARDLPLPRESTAVDRVRPTGAPSSAPSSMVPSPL